MIYFIIIIPNRLNDRHVMNVSVMWREDNHNVSWNLQLQAFTRKLLKFIHSLGLHRAHQAQPGTEIFLAKLSNIFQPVKYFSNNNASSDCRYIYWISRYLVGILSTSWTSNRASSFLWLGLLNSCRTFKGKTINCSRPQRSTKISVLRSKNPC